ncbi:C10 family peptidase [Pontiella sp.]|uniref:C10 family peptidase n=1 Tax=Pontiella sp. TaxID=2837462 RepID=UPI003562F946
MKRISLLAGMLAMQVSGAPISQETAVEWATSRMAGNPVMSTEPRTAGSVEVFPGGSAYSVYVVHLSPNGYLILNSDDLLPLLVSFSPDSAVDLTDHPQNAFRAMLVAHCARMEETLANPVASKATASVAPMAAAELHGPFLETSWNQNNPYNLRCPDDPAGSQYYDYRAAVGCVPTAYAQMLAFHRWPLHGQGSHAYTDSAGSITGPHSADFSDPYDWAAMQNAYDPWNTDSAPSKDAVAELMYELCVAAEVNFENGGTSASAYTLGNRLDDYFFFEPIVWSSSGSSLIAPMEAELRAGFPCIVSIPNHAVVADGLMVDDGETTYHINYGWGGTNNGWWTASGIPGGAMDSGITAIRPQLLAFPLTNSVAGAAGGSVELQWILPKRRETEVAQLAIKKFNDQTSAWEPFAVDAPLASRRFSETTTLWDPCDDFSQFTVYSTSPEKEWAVTNVAGVGSCFGITPDGYGGTEHVTATETITPTASTRLLLHTQYNLYADPFRISVSGDGTTFSEIWSATGSVDWSTVSIDLSAYAGQPIYIRYEYVVGSFYPDGGIWIDSISTQEVVHPELEGQPLHYTVLTNLPAGLHTLAAELSDTNGAAQRLAPAFILAVEDADALPQDWELAHGLDIYANDEALDPDGDGYSNLEEYICGTAPTNSASCWKLDRAAGALPAFFGYAGRQYEIEYCDNLASNFWRPMASGILGADGAIHVADYESATNAARYYRVNVRHVE